MRFAPSFAVATCLAASQALAGPCPQEPPLQNYTGGGQVACPCFVPNEEAGAVLTAPAAHYPIEVLRVGVGFGSVFGGGPTVLEQSIRIYGAGLPNPGAPIATLPGPQLADGFISEFDFEPLPGEITIPSGPFTVTLKFLNQTSGDPFAPTAVHDGAGCQPGKNVVFAIPGGWSDACVLGVTGNWVFYAIYRQVNCAVDTPETYVAMSVPVAVTASPNPTRRSSTLSLVLAEPAATTLTVYDASGRAVRTLADGPLSGGAHTMAWDGRAEDGRSVPAGVYFVDVRSGAHRARTKVVVQR